MTPTPIDARRHAPKKALVTLALAIAGVLAASGAQASGFQLNQDSAQALGRAFAGAETAPGDVTVVATNPAAMTDLKGVYFKADVQVISLSTKFSGAGNDITGAPLTGGNGGNGGGAIPVPAVYFAMPFGEHSHIGAAITVPYGFTTKYDEDWVGRYKAVKSKLQTLDFIFSYSYAVSNSFSIGGSIIGERASADLTSMVDYGTFLGVPQSHDGLARVTGSTTDYGWQLGFLWKPSARDRIGFNYKGKIDHTLEGNATFHDVPSQLAALVQLGNFQNTDNASAKLQTPATFSIGWWHQATDRFSFGVSAAHTDWSSFKELRIHYGTGQADTVEPENWKDTWITSAGGDYKLNGNWTLRAGVAYDETPTNDTDRTPRVPDGARTWLSFGADYTPSADFMLSIGFAHLWVDDGAIDNVGATAGPTGTTLIGNHKNSANILAVSGTFRF